MREWQHCGTDASEEVKKTAGKIKQIYQIVVDDQTALLFSVAWKNFYTKKERRFDEVQTGFHLSERGQTFFICPILSTKQLLNQAPSCDMLMTPFLQKTGRAAGQHSGFSASRWWMWKIPVRGLNVASLKPDDFYTSKVTQKLVEGKTGLIPYVLPKHHSPYLWCCFHCLPLKSVSILKLHSCLSHSLSANCASGVPALSLEAGVYSCVRA